MKVKFLLQPILVIVVMLMPVLNAAAACGTCNWYGRNYPVCCNQSTGWGWEENQSCIGPSECTNAGQTCTGCTSGSTTTSNRSTTTTSSGGGTGGGDCGTCIWYGTSYPLCCTDVGGWGWENSRSCISESTCRNAGQTVSGGGGGSITTTSNRSTTTTSSGGATGGGGDCGTCTWYGTNYPLCCTDVGGWGWENNRSCISESTCRNAGQTVSGGSGGGGSTTTSSRSTTTSNRSTTTSIASGGGSSSGSCPSSLTCPGNASCGCYSVSGLGANKRALTNAGASQYMIAAAMMETEKMDTNYSYCDGKSGDSCCCGVTKANWYESRTAGAGYSDYRSFCDAVNGSRSADVSNWNRLRSYWGSKYWAVHRNGESGNTNPNTADIQRFKEANDWTDSHIGGHLSDDIRFWVDVPAI